MKNFIKIYICLAMMLLAVIPSMAYMHTDFYIDQIGYRILSRSKPIVSVTRSVKDGQWNEEGKYINIDIPATVTHNDTVYTVVEIDANAFDCSFDHRNTISVSLPPTLKLIDAYAFRYCALKEIDIPDSVEEICGQAFANNYDLERVRLPKSLKRLGEEAFYQCGELTSLELPDSMQFIADNCFASCSNLISVKMPKYLQYLGNYAFAGCISLNRIDLPEGLTTTNEHTFDKCMALSEVTLPKTLREIGRYSFIYCTNLKSVHIPDSVSRIGRAAFFYCSSLSKVDIPPAVTRLEQHVFAWTGLKVIDLPENLEEVGIAPFMNCPNLLGITFPASVKSIGEGAVILVPSLQFVRCKSTMPPKLDKNGFDRYDMPLYVPKGCMSAYATADVWSNFKNVREVDDSVSVPVSYPSCKVTVRDSERGETVVYVEKGNPLTLTLQTAGSKMVSSVLMDGNDITDKVHSNNRLFIPAIDRDVVIEVRY